jgi:hypothetical protein
MVGIQINILNGSKLLWWYDNTQDPQKHNTRVGNLKTPLNIFL